MVDITIKIGEGEKKEDKEGEYWRDCGYCDGKGRDKFGATCPVCRGRGEHKFSKEPRKCKSCGGKGKLQFSEKCSYCRGKGWVEYR